MLRREEGEGRGERGREEVEGGGRYDRRGRRGGGVTIALMEKIKCPEHGGVCYDLYRPLARLSFRFYLYFQTISFLLLYFLMGLPLPYRIQSPSIFPSMTSRTSISEQHHKRTIAVTIAAPSPPPLRPHHRHTTFTLSSGPPPRLTCDSGISASSPVFSNHF